jgi:hypothetical protein
LPLETSTDIFSLFSKTPDLKRTELQGNLKEGLGGGFFRLFIFGMLLMFFYLFSLGSLSGLGFQLGLDH